MKSLQKRHFQLLEVMIAVFLVVVCALPALNAYLSMNKVQFDQVRLHQRDHLAHLAYGQIVECLYKKMIPWTEVESSQLTKLEQLAPLQEIDAQFKKLSYECEYQLSKKRYKTATTDKIHHVLIQLDLKVKDTTRTPKAAKSHGEYQYWIYAQKKLD